MKKEEEKLLHNIALRIKQIRKEQDLTQMELSIDSIDIRIIQRIEKGKTNIRIATLNKLSSKLNITLSELLDFTNLEV